MVALQEEATSSAMLVWCPEWSHTKQRTHTAISQGTHQSLTSSPSWVSQ